MWRVIRDKRVWYVLGVLALGVFAYKLLPDLLYLVIPGAGLGVAARTRRARAEVDAARIDEQVAKNDAVIHRLDPDSVDVQVRTVRKDAVSEDYWTPLELD